MVPEVKLYFVGSILHKEEPRDVDICGVMSAEDFDLTFGFTHASIHEAYKELEKTGEKSYKLKRLEYVNRGAGLVLSQIFGKRVDFKFLPPTMLYEPNRRIDVDKRGIHV
jgi:hypothetical protein